MYAEILATLSLTISVIIAAYMLRLRRRMEPIVSKAFSIMGKLGAEERWSREDFKEGERILLEAVFDQVPELKLLASLNPKVAEWIQNKPHAALGLYEKYGPLIHKLMEKKEPVGI